MKILVIEDEQTIQKALQKGLEKRGYDVDVASDGREAIDFFYEQTYDLILLDLNLPYYDGLELLKMFRKEDNQIKILILSARSDVEVKIEGLDLGANDYLTKPFFFGELIARIEALSRRKFVVENTILSLNGLMIDCQKKRVELDGNIIELTKKEFGILEYLLRHRERIIPLEEIIEAVWQDDERYFSNSIKVHLNHLRNKIGKEIIKNKRGEGYYVE